ncbi:MAG: ABC transporter, permease protein 2 (cluster 5, nickel/peptides/opines) [uncultured Caballeronia sp.]|nr:MAG: ABC transporter, permease protein 2 (cluster 5, nickel/peptides/opines) [uncultured Caballeronia sp.]
MSLVAVIALASLYAPLIAPHGETETVGDVWMMPGAGHWLGTDSIGRDMFSRLLYGGRTTLGLALAITLLSFSLGIVTGFAAAVLGRKVDQVLSRIVDTLMAMPVLIFALMILSVLGTSMQVLIGTIPILDSTRVFRLARLVAQGIAVQEYVEAARRRGEEFAWIIRREILPNAVPPLLAEFGMRFGFTILFVAGLSFLGLGIQPPYAANWGHGPRQRIGDQFRRHCAIGAGRGNCVADDWYQPDPSTGCCRCGPSGRRG